LATLAVASASVIKSSTWQKARPRDLSKFKPVLPKVSPRPHWRKVLTPRATRTEPVSRQTPRQTTCGISGAKFNPQIVGGQNAAPHQFPWQVGIFMDNSYFCGGSIISDEWIMTAAHCVDGFFSYDVIIGAHEINSFFEEGRVEVSTTDDYIHPQWDPFNLANDIGFLKVPKIEFNEYVSPICLPSTQEVGESLTGEIITVSGWGRESDSSSGIAEILNFVTAPIITNQECNDVYGIVGSGVVCIDTAGGKGTCNGDSGGPMIRDRDGDNAWTQYGVVSFGASLGCEAGLPAGFTRVTEYLDHILDVTGVSA